ncbi:hypothetical protein HA402_013715 [Bradysia odoriphaga]|nr:hypothetical protein HA402_013715 [Bradysia odoriphaga]
MSSTSIRSSYSEDSFTSIKQTATTRSDLNVVDPVDLVEDIVEYTDVPLCRICWLDGSIDELIALPCKCQGTVGNAHADCLKEWERVRKSRRCEICKEVYMKKRHFMTVLRSFFQYQYAGILFRKISNISATALIAYANIVLGEMNITYLNSAIKASSGRSGMSYPVILLSTAIFPYFVINYFAIDFAMSEMIDCYHIICSWWANER